MPEFKIRARQKADGKFHPKLGLLKAGKVYRAKFSVPPVDPKDNPDPMFEPADDAADERKAAPAGARGK